MKDETTRKYLKGITELQVESVFDFNKTERKINNKPTKSFFFLLKSGP